MTLIRRLDAWLGLRVFHPPIIWLCQQTGVTQWAVYRYGWWLYALWNVWDDDRHSAAITIWVVLFALARTLSAGLALNRPVRASLPLRAFIVTMIVAMLLAALLLGSNELHWIALNALPLLAEYAATITIIPPRRERERATRLVPDAA